MNKKIITALLLLLCVIFAGGCINNSAATQTQKEPSTVAELIETENFRNSVSLASFSSASFNYDGADENAVIARAASKLGSDRFNDADVCSAGDLITIDITCKFGTIELVKEELSFILGSNTLASEIEEAIIAKKLEKGKDDELTVIEKLEYGLTKPVERKLDIAITVKEIKHCELTDAEKASARSEIEEEAKKELAWKSYINSCNVIERSKTVFDAIKESKRKSDEHYALSYGKDVTVKELTGISSDDYEKSLTEYAINKYKEDVITALLIKENAKDCAVTAEEKSAAYKEYAEILGVRDSDLSESDKKQIDEQLKKDKLKDVIYATVKK